MKQSLLWGFFVAVVTGIILYFTVGGVITYTASLLSGYIVFEIILLTKSLKAANVRSSNSKLLVTDVSVVNVTQLIRLLLVFSISALIFFLLT